MNATNDIEIRALFEQGELRCCAALVIQAYGQELFGFLRHLCGDEDLANDAFSQFCEDFWTGLPSFRWQASVRTWSYTLARHAGFRTLDAQQRQRQRRAPSADVAALVAEHQSRTAPFLRTEIKDGIARLREQLCAEERMLLSLRVDRQMPWLDIAQIITDAELTPDELKRVAASARKRFERIKFRLRELATKEGLWHPDE